jgi:hypothetical protein
MFVNVVTEDDLIGVRDYVSRNRADHEGDCGEQHRKDCL